MGVAHSILPVPRRNGVRISALQTPKCVCSEPAGWRQLQGECTVSCDSPGALGHRAAREEGHNCFSPSTLSPHSRNTQPELITVAGVCAMALTPQEPPVGPDCGYLQNREPHLWKGSCCTRTHSSCTASCSRAPTPRCQHQRASLRN